jgi:hypothetical protein
MRSRGTWLGLTLAAGLLLGASPADAATIFVDDDDPGGPGCGSITNPCETIQEGIDAASAGDTVQVGAGTYVEQLDIDTAITLRGAGPVTMIKSPDGASLDDKFGPGDRRPVVFVHDTGDAATIEDLKVNGDAQGGPGCGFEFFGIAYVNAPGTVADVTVTHIRNQPLDSCESGFAVYNSNLDQATRSWAVRDSTIQDYQKQGITAEEAGLSTTIERNAVTGAPEAVDDIVQNGIRVEDGFADVTGNTVVGNACELPACGLDPLTDELAAGISFLGAVDGTRVLGNDVHGNDAGVMDELGQGTHLVEENDLSGNDAMGVYVDDGELAVNGNDLSDGAIGIAAVSQNDGTDHVPAVGAVGNTILGAGTGVAVSSDGIAPAPTVAASFNRIAGSSTAGLQNDADASITAENNWWGCSSGPEQPACDSIANTGSGGVDFDPWLKMTMTKGPKVNGRRKITVRVRKNSDGDAPLPNEFPDGTPIHFTTTRGTIPSIGTLLDGRASVTLRKPGSTHRATITATLDGQAISIQAR